MRMRRGCRASEGGQALILALVLLGLIATFSVSALRLASASRVTLTTTRETAFNDAQQDAGAAMARQLIADGLGCSQATVNAAFGNASIDARVAQSTTPLSPPAACAGQGTPDGDEGAVPGDYVVCSTVQSGGRTYQETITVNAQQIGGSNTVNVDVVHVDYRRTAPC